MRALRDEEPLLQPQGEESAHRFDRGEELRQDIARLGDVFTIAGLEERARVAALEISAARCDLQRVPVRRARGEQHP